MVSIFIKSESRYPISRKIIYSTIERLVKEKMIRGRIEVSVSIVGNRQMKRFNKRYRNLDKTTDVLSFSLTESNDLSASGFPEAGQTVFIDPPDDVLRLGDIVVSYPEAVSEAAEEGKLVDEKISELVEHGFLHLLGYHHE